MVESRDTRQHFSWMLVKVVVLVVPAVLLVGEVGVKRDHFGGSRHRRLLGGGT